PGRCLPARRSSGDRVASVGYRVARCRIWLCTVSAVLAGLAGALYVPQVGIINPNEFQPLNSIELVVWVAVGGRGTLYGAALGAAAGNYAKSYFTVALPDAWLYVLGGLVVLVTLALPKGMIGLAARLRRLRHA